MSQFYNRYIPPKKPETKLKPTQRQESDGNNTHDHIESRPSKKRKTSAKSKHEAIDTDSHIESKNTQPTNEAQSGEGILSKYSVSQFAKSKDGQAAIKLRRPTQSKKEVANEDGVEKHATVLSKYKSSRTRSEGTGDQDGGNSTLEGPPAVEAQHHGLTPIPQPAASEIKPKTPTFSTLPSWQATPAHVRPSKNQSFADFGLSQEILSNLKAEGIERTFPVQATVIPLLAEGRDRHKGDICVSAATGSGKTLAYIIPVIESLRAERGSGLRAVVVVPTRELVNQVRQTCQACAAGLGLKIVTTLGSKSLRDEKKALIFEEEVYDPEAYKEELETPIDWTRFSLEKTLHRARHRDPDKAINYVTRRRIIPDLLITTPGRLVDHLQNTDGFHVDNVKWLVIDEADRLLNESYQEWIDVVVPALRSRRATEMQDKILLHMRMKVPPRVVRKVLLSATMTRDISKLNQIGLDNPKLVVLKSSQDLGYHIHTEESVKDGQDLVDDTKGEFVLPTSLHEFAVTFKEGFDKPLLLLQLLQNHLNISITNEGRAKSTNNGQASASNSESEQSDSDTDSDSDSVESDSETSSDSSTSSSKSQNTARRTQFTLPPRQVDVSSSADSVTRALVFTRSTASASRLSRLLCIISPALAPQIATLTRNTASSASSRKALSSFRTGKTPILIATDRASRGIDVPGLQHVISYDIPGSTLAYVHRVGRTARAGKDGSAWTLVEHREGKWFWHEIGGKSNECMIKRSAKVKKMSIELDEGEDLRKRYEDALQRLGSEVRGR